MPIAKVGAESTLSLISLVLFLFCCSKAIPAIRSLLNRVFTGKERFGLGIRFFRTEEFKPLRATVGLFGFYDNYSEVWFGIDTHIAVIARTELHTGITILKLLDPNRPNVQPTFGLAFRLF